MGNSRLSAAAARALLSSVANVQVRFRTIGRWAVLAAIPITPTMVELADWPLWIDPPGPVPSFHMIYWWAGMVLTYGAYEAIQRGRRKERWAGYWQERGRTLGGNMEQIGEVFLGSRGGGGRVPSTERISAGILQQIADIVADLTQPSEDVHIMACLLVPEYEGTGATRRVVALQATVYNENAGRNFSRIDIDAPGPAAEAFRSGFAKIVSDTSEEPYRAQFADRPYKSVMAYPVHIGHGVGNRLAVVTIDATRAGYFSDEGREEKGIDAAVFPLLKLIGLVRIAETKGGRRGTK